MVLSLPSIANYPLTTDHRPPITALLLKSPPLQVIFAASMDNKEAVQAANREFYRAIETGAIERMDAVWSHTDEVRCIHPGWDLLIGWARVRESWEQIFDSDQRMRIQPSEVRISSADNFAWVTCVENITVFQEDSFDTVQAAATNLFMRYGDHWLLVHHHASPIPMIVPDSASDTVQ